MERLHLRARSPNQLGIHTHFTLSSLSKVHCSICHYMTSKCVRSIGNAEKTWLVNSVLKHSAHQRFYDNALYKSTTYFLIYWDQFQPQQSQSMRLPVPSFKTAAGHATFYRSRPNVVLDPSRAEWMQRGGRGRPAGAPDERCSTRERSLWRRSAFASRAARPCSL